MRLSRWRCSISPGTVCLPLAAVLNFGIYPQGYLPQLGITAVVVPGKEIGETAQGDAARFLDNKRIEGTIAEMVEEALSFCKRNMKTPTIIDPQTGRRTDQTEYPISALREAILNALIHRITASTLRAPRCSWIFSLTVWRFTAPAASMGEQR